MSNKDFLSQFSDNGKKPASFKEEERVKVTKEKKPLNVKVLVIVLVALALIVGLVLFFLLRPTIEVREFAGSNASEVKAWIKQNDIDSQGVIFKEEYNFDYDEGYVIYQSIEAGKKIRKNAKMDFTVSLGANPEDIIAVPDIESMYKEELQQWVKENKLTKTKIITAFSDDKEVGEVISYEFKGGADFDNFKRSSQLTITVSKGPQPAGSVVVENFVKQDYTIVEAWAKKNKVELNKETKYSDDIAKDLVISQSIDPNKTIKEGESLTVVVSLGKAVYAENLIGMSENEANRWANKNGIYLLTEYVYSNYEKDCVIYQSIDKGNIVKEDMSIAVSLGKPDLSSATTLSELNRLVEEYNKKGADLRIAEGESQNSDDIPVGELITKFGVEKCGKTLNVVVSKGRNIWVLDSYPSEEPKYAWKTALNDSIEGTEDYVRKLCDLSGLSYNVVYGNHDTVPAHSVVSITYKNGEPIDVNGGYYISESEVITVLISVGPKE